MKRSLGREKYTNMQGVQSLFYLMPGSREVNESFRIMAFL